MRVDTAIWALSPRKAAAVGAGEKVWLAMRPERVWLTREAPVTAATPAPAW
jgi:hypothetical protein